MTLMARVGTEEVMEYLPGSMYYSLMIWRGWMYVRFHTGIHIALGRCKLSFLVAHLPQ
jgi:hypothetical protein